MAIGVTVGFMPAPVAGAIAPAAGAEASANGKSPLGLFDALLQVATALGAGTEASVVTEQQTALAATIGQQFTAVTAGAAAPGTATAGADPTAVLSELFEGLTVLADAVETGVPVEASLEAEIANSLDALGAVLGLAAAPAPDLEASAAATLAAHGAAALDPLATIAAAAAPVVSTAPEAEAAAVLAAGTAPAAGPAAGPTLPAPGTATIANLIAIDSTLPPPTPAADEAPQLPAALKALADRIADMASALEAKSPALATRLDALAKQIVSGEIDVTALARLGIDPGVEPTEAELAKVLDRLLTPIAEGRPKAEAAFANATLALPKVFGNPSARLDATAAPSAGPTGLPVSDAIDPASGTSAEVRADVRAERPEGQPQGPNVKASFQAHVHAGASAPAEAPQAPTSVAAGTASQVAASVAVDTKAIHAAYKAPVQQINIPQVAFEIVRQVEAGGSRFQIRLDPPELGRIDVKLDVDKAGNVTARMTVERAETLDLMQRDQRTLERALAQAGLDGSKTNLEFSLRQNPFGRDEQQQRNGSGNEAFPRFGLAETDEPAIPPPHIFAYRGMSSAGGVNLFV